MQYVWGLGIAVDCSDMEVGMKSKIEVSSKDALGWFFIGISVLMLVKSVALCFSNDIWYDELFTVGMIEHSYGELICFTAADVHPPLYYCLTKLFVDLCKLIIPGAGTIIPAKIMSVLPYFILLLYSVTFIRKRFGIFTGGLFLFCVAAMPQMSAYMVEVRMYGWALLFVTAAFLHAHGCVTAGSRFAGGMDGIEVSTGKSEHMAKSDAKAKSRRRWNKRLHGAALVLYGLAAAYTQYFACVAVVMVYLYVLIGFTRQDKTRIKEWCLYVVISIAGYVPWLFALTGQLKAVSDNYWILPLTWRSLGGCVKFLLKPAFQNDTLNVILAVVLFVIYAEVVGGSLIRYVRAVKREKEDNVSDDAKILKSIENVYHNDSVLHAAAGLCVLIGLVLFGFAASILIRPVFVYRYMIPAMGCFWLCFVICLDDILCKLDLALLLQRFKSGETVNQLHQTEQAVCEGESTAAKVNSRRALYSAKRILLTFIVLFLIVGLRNYRAFLGEEEYKIRLMKETQTALSQIRPEDIVIYNFDQVQAVTSYYLEEGTERYLWNVTAEPLIQEIIGSCGTIEETDTIKGWLTQSEGEAEHEDRQVWFIGSFNSRDDIAAQWREEGLRVEETGSYLLERYWFNLYKISK